jgi:hypothetical protein
VEFVSDERLETLLDCHEFRLEQERERLQPHQPGGKIRPALTALRAVVCWLDAAPLEG